MLKGRDLSIWQGNCWVTGIDQQSRQALQLQYIVVILYKSARKILPNAPLNILRGVQDIDLGATNDPNLSVAAGASMWNLSWDKNKVLSSSLPLHLSSSLCLWLHCATAMSRKWLRSLHRDCQCLNLPLPFVFFCFFYPLTAADWSLSRSNK